MRRARARWRPARCSSRSARRISTSSLERRTRCATATTCHGMQLARQRVRRKAWSGRKSCSPWSREMRERDGKRSEDEERKRESEEKWSLRHDAKTSSSKTRKARDVEVEESSISGSAATAKSKNKKKKAEETKIDSWKACLPSRAHLLGLFKEASFIANPNFEISRCSASLHFFLIFAPSSLDKPSRVSRREITAAYEAHRLARRSHLKET